MATRTDGPKSSVLEQEPQAIAGRAAGHGRRRLDRSNPDVLITAVIGGLEVSLGGLAAMTVLGSALQAAPWLHLYGALALAGAAFPIGFLFVIVGRSELFTENFLIPVVAISGRERSVGSLAGLWGLSWVGNLLGCAIMAALLSAPGAIGDPIKEGYRAYTEYKLGMAPLGLFVSAVLAGMVMTALTWLLLAVHDALGHIAVIFAAGYLLFAANLSHSMVGAAVIFAGFHLVGRGVADAIGWVLIATLGNLVGGVGLVTLFRLAQAREQARQGPEENDGA
jgi:formate-nitrite transporter family protein